MVIISSAPRSLSVEKEEPGRRGYNVLVQRQCWRERKKPRTTHNTCLDAHRHEAIRSGLQKTNIPRKRGLRAKFEPEGLHDGMLVTIYFGKKGFIIISGKRKEGRELSLSLKIV